MPLASTCGGGAARAGCTPMHVGPERAGTRVVLVNSAIRLNRRAVPAAQWRHMDLNSPPAIKGGLLVKVHFQTCTCDRHGAYNALASLPCHCSMATSPSGDTSLEILPCSKMIVACWPPSSATSLTCSLDPLWTRSASVKPIESYDLPLLYGHGACTVTTIRGQP